MGLTINYDVNFQGTQKQLIKELTKIRSACLDKPFEKVSEIQSVIITKEIIDTYHFWQNYCTYPNNSFENLEKRNKALKDLGVTTDIVINLDVNNKLKPKTQIVIFGVWPGKGCENAKFYFIKNKTNDKWYASSFCKTQYAENFIRCHLLVIDVLDMLKEKGF